MLLVFAAPLFADTEVGGVLRGTVTWSKQGGPYAVVQNVEVANGSILRIEPGAEIRFGRFSLIVRGQIVARGNKDSPIVFTSGKSEPEPGDWLFIQLTQESAPAKFLSDGTFASGCVLEYCTIEYGAGLNLVGASPWISSCTIQYNYAEEGGGIFSGGGNPTIQDNTIAYNRANRDGGGIRTANGHPKIIGNRIAYNTARASGGGIATNNSQSTIRDNTISHNWARVGGGIATGIPRTGETSITGQSHSRPIIKDNAITHNTVYSSGGGICVRGTPEIIGNRIFFNRVTKQSRAKRNHRDARMGSTDRRGFGGAGILVEGTYGGPAKIERNAIVGNHGAKWGGAMFSDNASIVFADNLVSRNRATEFGGGLSIVNRRSVPLAVGHGHGDSIAIAGSVFRDNDGGDIEVAGAGGQNISIRRCNHFGAELAILNHCGAGIDADDVWLGGEDLSSNSRIYDIADDQSLGRVICSGQREPHTLLNVPTITDAMLERMNTVPENFRSAQGIFRVQGAPPSVTSAWEPIDEEWVAGYRVQIAEITPTYHDRIPAKTDKGRSPIDVGRRETAKIGNLKPDTQYEISVLAVDEAGTECARTSSILVKTSQ